jgi:hypothetical protein
MHKFFTWDDRVAATKFREDQARKLISDFIITVKVHRSEVSVQEFVHLPNGSKAGYTQFSKVMDDKDLARDFMVEQLRVVQGHVHKILAYAKVLGFEETVLKLSSEVDNLYERVQAAAA